MAEEKRIHEGLWVACSEWEEAARVKLSPALAPFWGPVRVCYEAGVQVATLPAARSDAEDMRLAALFLKRTLTDLRVVWLLVQTGYTSQAASVAAALFEYALSVVKIAGAPERVLEVQDHDAGDVPWGAYQLSKEYAKRIQAEAVRAGDDFTESHYKVVRTTAYEHYKLLCKIKHPTTRSALHDALGAAAPSGEIGVVATPDLRESDLSMKAMILTISLTYTFEAIWQFTIAQECEQSEAFRDFVRRLRSIMPATSMALQTVARGPLPFDLSDSWVQTEHAKRRASVAERVSD